MAARTWIIVPMKSFHASKTRLAPLLGAGDRARLAQAMFADVLTAARAVGGLGGVLAVTPDQAVAAQAREHRADALCSPKDLNEALLDAAAHLQRCSDCLAVLPGDVPLVKSSDISELVMAQQAAGGLVVAPDRERRGTNALAMPARGDFQFRFGENSFERHRQSARERAMSFASFVNANLELDVDTPSDLRELMERDAGESTRGVLASLAVLLEAGVSAHG